MRTRVVVGMGLMVLAAGLAWPVRAQLPFASVKSNGQTVTPAYEGWYRNSDGTFSLSFGYFNRNSEEVVRIPIGPDNFIEPGNQNQGQPTEFHPRRHWGVFAVRVPADFGDKKVTWTVRFRGANYAIPGSLHQNWQIDALEGEAGSGNTPPAVKFAADGPEGSGPGGITAGPLAAAVGKPLSITAWARDDGKSASSIAGRGTAANVTLTWFSHQGPGKVTFEPATGRAGAAGGQVTTQATFSEPGNYVIRIRANDGSGVSNAGHAQCCWTNAFVRVEVK
jgi:hypothetical protein